MTDQAVIRVLATSAALLVLSACAASEPPTQVGAIRTELTGVSVRGQTYRLRNATFAVAGPQNLSVSSEDYLNEDAIVLDLPSGSYTVTLSEGWSLERADANNVYTGVNATLLSAAMQTVVVEQSQTRTVTYTFRTGTDIVTICNDCLSIQIAIDDNVCPEGVSVTYTGTTLPAQIAGTYVEAFDCTRDEGGSSSGGDFTHCFRKDDGSAWRIWNTGCGWEYGLRQMGSWVRHARTYAGVCSEIPASQLRVDALTSETFFDRFGDPITGVSSTCE